MVGDDEVEAEATRSLSFGEGSHPGVDGDYEASALCVGCLKHRGLQSIAFAETVRDVEANDAAEHFDGSFEKDDGCGAVYVVVAVEQNRLASGDGASRRSTAAVMPSIRKGSWSWESSGLRNAKASSGW